MNKIYPNVRTFLRMIFSLNRSLVYLFVLLFQTAIPAQEPVDLAIRSLGPLEWLEPGSYPLQVSITNFDPEYDAIYNMQLNWQIDNGEISSEYIDEFMIYPNSIPGGPMLYSDRVMPTELLTFNEPGTYQLSVWITDPNGFPDQDIQNNSKEITVRVVDELPEKQELLYFGSHQECFPCGGYGETVLHNIEIAYGDLVHVVRVHAFIGSDVFAYEESEILNNLYVWDYTGHPAFVHDLFQFPMDNFSFVSYSIGDFEAIDYRMQCKSPVEVSIEDLEINTETLEYSGEVHAKFYADYAGALCVNAIITEDSLLAYQSGYPGINLEHMDILRDMNAGILGDPTVIPFYATEGLTYVYPFSGVLDGNWDINQIEVTGLVQVYDPLDSLNAEILNSERIKLIPNGTIGVSNHSEKNTIRVFPNPVSDILTISGAFEGQVKWTLSDISGRIVEQSKIPLSKMNNGLSLDISNIPNGMYFLDISSTSNHSVVKVEILH